MTTGNEYSLYYNTPRGKRILSLTDWISLDYALADRGVGQAVLRIPGHYKPSIFGSDYLLEIWRKKEIAVQQLAGEKLWLLRSWEFEDVGRDGIWNLKFACLNDILQRRIVDYNAENAYTSKLDYADDMMKEIISENFGAAATDATRDISSYLAIQPSMSAAPAIRKAFARRKILDVLQELSDASYINGTYLSFDIVTVLPPSEESYSLEFRTYTGQRGMDRRSTSDNPKMLGSEYGNLRNAKILFSTENEKTRGIAGGQGIGSARAIARYTHPVRSIASPFNLIEEFVDSRNENDATGLLNDAEAIVRESKPKIIITGEIIQKEGFIYGVDWSFGDHLTAQVCGYSVDARVAVIKFSVTRDTGEVIDAVLSGEAIYE